MKLGWKSFAGIGAAATAAAVGVFLLVTDLPVADIAEVATDGGEKLLREEMRLARGGPRVLVLALDGVGVTELQAAVRGGKAPQLSALLGAASADSAVFEHGYVVADALSILPSTTYAAWASVFTGEPAGRTGVPGNEWFAREEPRFYAPAPVSVSGVEDAVEVYSEGLLGRVLQVPTLYEVADVRSHVSLSAVHRGADLLTTPDPGAVTELAAASVKGLTGEEDVEQEVYEELDRTAVESLIESLREHGLPDLQVVYFPGVDLYTHVADSPLTEQAAYLAEVLDPAIGLILREYGTQGGLDDLFVVIVSDHGHTPVLNDDRHALGTDGNDEPGWLLEQTGFRLRPFELELDDEDEDYQAVLAYQGAIAYVYLADRSTCPGTGERCDWVRPPRLREDVLPVAAAFYQANETGLGVPELRGTIDLIFAREPRGPGEDALPFQVFDGESLVPVADYLRAKPRPDLLELEARLEDLGTGPFGHRAGDVLLLARSGMQRPIEERYYFSGEYHSWHGSPGAQDSRITLAIARQGMSGNMLRERLQPVLGTRPSQLDVVPLILELLGRPGGSPRAASTIP